MFLDGLFWSKVLRILFFSIDSTCSILLSIVFVVFVLLVVSRVKSYVHIVLDTRTPVLCPNSFGTEEVECYTLEITFIVMYSRVNQLLLIINE